MTDRSNIPEQVTRTFDVASWLKSVLGATVTMAQVNDIITFVAGVLTIIFTIMKMIEWVESRKLRKNNNKSLVLLNKWLEKHRTMPAPLDEDQSHHDHK